MDSVIQRNTDNMTTLWHGYSAQTVAVPQGRVMYSTHWPHKVWVEGNIRAQDYNLVINTVSQLLLQEPQRALVAWQKPMEAIAALYRASTPGKIAVSALVGMSLNFNRLDETWFDGEPRLDRHSVGLEDTRFWADLCRLGFGYRVDLQAIRSACQSNHNRLHWYSHQGQPVGTSLIALTGSTAGFHQISVLPQWRGKGMASEIVRQMIAWAVMKDANEAVLQASPMGLGVYKKLGFVEDFRLKYYKHQI